MTRLPDRGDLLYREVIEYLHLPWSLTNTLLRAGIGTIDALCAHTPKSLRAIDGVGAISARDIRGTLAVRCGRALINDTLYTPEYLVVLRQASEQVFGEQQS
ncbi:helix-hairpin-helix domain-containing protein [Paraburkholderia silvatlantica]|uniref:helix-hairpin-helix domain-containing protein n=1 Tax=Paraburkholderia silvatlantica TaxID=321895 RepID=UPI0037521BB5